jgi:hypothetical protein
MTDLSEYEMRVLRQMATGADENFVSGAALWAVTRVLHRRGLLGIAIEDGPPSYFITDAGRALVRARDAELTEANNGHRF